jgi:hypothetical protein
VLADVFGMRIPIAIGTLLKEVISIYSSPVAQQGFTATMAMGYLTLEGLAERLLHEVCQLGEDVDAAKMEPAPAAGRRSTPGDHRRGTVDVRVGVI